MDTPLTYQWITPILLGIIGLMVERYLSSIMASFKEMAKSIEATNAEMRKYFKENEERHGKNEKDIIRLQEHIDVG